MSSFWIMPPPALVASFEPVNPSSLLAVGIALPSLAILAVGLRLWCRIWKKIGLGADDWSILASLILCIGMGIAMIIGSAVGAIGQPTPVDPRPAFFATVLTDQIVTTEQIKYAFNMMHALAFGCVKYSVILFYRRLFRVTIWTFGFFFTVLFECGSNVWAVWGTLDDLLTHCANEVEFFEGDCISDIIVDVMILLTPLPIIWKLQMSSGKKLAVSGVFLLGFLTVAFGIIRLVIFVNQLADSFSSSQGILIMSTWFYWTMIELGMAIVAACLPALRPLFGDIIPVKLSDTLHRLLTMPSLRSSSRGSKKSSNGKFGGQNPNGNSFYTQMHDQPYQGNYNGQAYALKTVQAETSSSH
ncbi:hypothetical protein MMC10_008918 [Thelotrema lepadinum]|nr:hypothetical protein [Thelotrema lepadinum]